MLKETNETLTCSQLNEIVLQNFKATQKVSKSFKLITNRYNKINLNQIASKCYFVQKSFDNTDHIARKYHSGIKMDIF